MKKKGAPRKLDKIETTKETRSEEHKNKTRRCDMEGCNAKISPTQSIIGKCKCNGVHCAKHSFAGDHNCPYDYRAEFEDRARKDNPKIEGEKIRKL